MDQKQTVLRLILTVIFTSAGCRSQSFECGKAPQKHRIVGGVESTPGSWPWMVSLQINETGHICGGSLVNERWVLTAAHCMDYWFEGDRYFASLGRHNYSDPNSNEVEIEVKSVHMHPSYDNETLENDMCLLELDGAVTFGPFIQPVCLTAKGSTLHTGEDSWVAGWGFTEEEGINSPSALLEVTLPIIGYNECSCILKSYLVPNTICAGLKEGGKDSCQGDSGGPLVVKQDSVWVQAGVVSYGYGCARPSSPGVYSEVSSYQDWIKSIVTPSNRLGFVDFTSSGEDPDEDFICDSSTSSTTDVTTTTTTTTEMSSTEYSTDDKSIYGSAEITRAYLSQLFSCVMALLLLVWY